MSHAPPPPPLTPPLPLPVWRLGGAARWGAPAHRERAGRGGGGRAPDAEQLRPGGGGGAERVAGYEPFMFVRQIPVCRFGLTNFARLDYM